MREQLGLQLEGTQYDGKYVIVDIVQKTHRDVFGRYFAEVTANEFATPFGTYRGGYVPAQADPRIVQDPDEERALHEQWDEYNVPIELHTISSPYRELTRPVLQYLDEIDRRGGMLAAIAEFRDAEASGCAAEPANVCARRGAKDHEDALRIQVEGDRQGDDHRR